MHSMCNFEIEVHLVLVALAIFGLVFDKMGNNFHYFLEYLKRIKDNTFIRLNKK